MITMYHGTDDHAAAEILKTGLKPHRETAYQVRLDTGETLQEYAEIEKEPLTYLTRDEEVAAEFARFRAEYLKAEMGTDVAWGITVGQSNVLTKIGGDVRKTARPVVLKIEVDDELAGQMTMDPLMGFADAWICKCEIPAERISRWRKEREQ